MPKTNSVKKKKKSSLFIFLLISLIHIIASGWQLFRSDTKNWMKIFTCTFNNMRYTEMQLFFPQNKKLEFVYIYITRFWKNWLVSRKWWFSFSLRGREHCLISQKNNNNKKIFKLWPCFSHSMSERRISIHLYKKHISTHTGCFKKVCSGLLIICWIVFNIFFVNLKTVVIDSPICKDRFLDLLFSGWASLTFGHVIGRSQTWTFWALSNLPHSHD